MNADSSASSRRAGKAPAKGRTTAQETGSSKKQTARKTAPSSPKSQESGELRSGPIAGTTLIHGVTFRIKALRYAEVDGLAMFEGDIVLGNVEELTKEADGGPAVSSIGVVPFEEGEARRWPDATVPFEIDPGLPRPERVTDAIAHWHARTRIRFIERTPANATHFPDSVHFVPGNGCSSRVGRQGGEQHITLGPNCSTGNAIHEIGHTVGLWHEQSREDRDQHVTIVFANIRPDMQHNFLQQIADGDDLGPYDFASIMHYPATAFAIDPDQPTLVPRTPIPSGVTMGQRTGLSQGDVDGVHMMYPASVQTARSLMAKTPTFDGSPRTSELGPMSAPAPHQPPAMTRPVGMAEQLGQLAQMVAQLQQELSAVQASHEYLLAQMRTWHGGTIGQFR
ncbi:M12 family metallopeptidase [Streptomyces sp. NPDC052079]|uniref:M12 family metallopeptidase n=1 Tax=Streptomyces sp. NPDC052079 TaxID=3155526 RepID=UPI00343D0A47